MRSVWLPAIALLIPTAIRADEPNLREQAAASLKKSVEYFRENVAVSGSYLWRYSDDLKKREGESKATPTQGWIQPPGTPTIGMAYVAAYEATGDAFYLEAARETGMALVKGQMRSGGWEHSMEFDPAARKRDAYRVDPPGDKQRNLSTYDDNTTQSAVKMLIRLDAALEQKDAVIHEAARYALDAIGKSQFPNGGWPQGYSEFPDPSKFPAKKACYYEGDYPRATAIKDYRPHYTLNDGLIPDMLDVLFEAERIYGDKNYRDIAKKAGDFLLLAQMPDPQPGWAQQYDVEMRPAWARKFEPPSITGGESQGAMFVLLRLYRETGDKKYIETLPKAIEYYKKSLLPDGKLARFYELKTNKPLYFTKQYELTYKDDDLPTHYGFKIGSKLPQIELEYDRLKNLKPEDVKKLNVPKLRAKTPSNNLIVLTKAVIAALDKEGRWVEDGKLRYHGADDPTMRIISCATFARNVETLSAYLAATRP